MLPGLTPHLVSKLVFRATNRHIIGPYWAFQEGWLSWTSSVTDNALYPVLFLDYMLGIWDNPDLESGGLRWLFLVSFTAVLTYLNYRYKVPHNTFLCVCVFCPTTLTIQL